MEMMLMTVSSSINVKARERSRSLDSVNALKRRRFSEVRHGESVLWRIRGQKFATANPSFGGSEVSGGDGTLKRESGEDRGSKFEIRKFTFAARGPDTAGVYRQCKNVQALKRFNHDPDTKGFVLLLLLALQDNVFTARR